MHDYARYLDECISRDSLTMSIHGWMCINWRLHRKLYGKFCADYYRVYRNSSCTPFYKLPLVFLNVLDKERAIKLTAFRHFTYIRLHKNHTIVKLHNLSFTLLDYIIKLWQYTSLAIDTNRNERHEQHLQQHNPFHHLEPLGLQFR